MILLLKRVTVLLLTTFAACDPSLPNASLTTPEKCQVDLTVECALDLLNQIQNGPAQELPQEDVEHYLNKVMNVTTLVKKHITDQDNLISYGNGALDVTEKLVSALVRKTDTIESISISLQTLGVQVIMVGQNTSVNKRLSLITSTASMDIELIGISEYNNASVVFMSFTDVADYLRPSLFNTLLNTTKTMMSAVVSATLLQAADTTFTSVSFTLKHVHELDPGSFLSCVFWKKPEWVEDGCSITGINSTHTVCSCDHMGTFAIIMQTYPRLIYTSWVIVSTVSEAVGMIFLSLSILTFAFCRRHTNATNTALINLCISLLLAMLVHQFMQHFQVYTCPRQHLFVVLEGVLLFLCLSAAMWMLIEAVLLFISVKNISEVRSNQGEGLSWKWLIVIGYFIPLFLVVSCALVFHEVYTGLTCNRNGSKYVFLFFYIPVFVIFALNMILFIIIIIIIVIFNLIRLKNQKLQMSKTNDTKLIISVIFKSLVQFFIFGFSWIILFISQTFDIAFYFFMLLNFHQGTFIFINHCLLNQEVRQQYRKFLCALCCFNNVTLLQQMCRRLRGQHERPQGYHCQGYVKNVPWTVRKEDK